MSALARLSTAAGGVIVLLAGSAMIASAHTASAPSQTPHAQTTTTAHQTTWEGNGSDNLPCTGGTLHWIFTGGDNGTFADLYINGACSPTPANRRVRRGLAPGTSTPPAPE